MFDILKKIWKTGTVTKQFLLEEAPARFRGKPVLTTNESGQYSCTGCEACVTTCPTNSIQLTHMNEEHAELSLSYSECIYCGLCAEVCEPRVIRMTNEYRLATKEKSDLTIALLVPESRPAPGVPQKGEIRR